MKTPFEHLTPWPPRRRLEWWALLNAKHTPTDLPVGEDEEEVFKWLEKTISRNERLKFWNGEFEHGKNVEKFL